MGIVSSQPVVPTQQMPGVVGVTAHSALRPMSPSSNSEITVSPLIQGTKKARKSAGGSVKRKRVSDGAPHGTEVQNPQEESAGAEQQVPKKKAKRAKVAPQAEDTVITESAKPLAHVAIPPATVDAADAANVKKTKKRKQPTGRPSGLSFTPLEDEAEQTQAEAETSSPTASRAEESTEPRKQKRKRQKSDVSSKDGAENGEQAQGTGAVVELQQSTPMPTFTAINSPTMRKATLAPNALTLANDHAASEQILSEAEGQRKKTKKKKRRHSGKADEVVPASEAGPQQASEETDDNNARSNSGGEQHSAEGSGLQVLAQKRKKKRRSNGQEDGSAQEMEALSEVALETPSKKPKKKRRPSTRNVASPEVKQEEEETSHPESGSKPKKRKRAHSSDQPAESSPVLEGSVAPVEIASTAPQSAQSSVSPEESLPEESLAQESVNSRRKHKVKRKSRVEEEMHVQSSSTGAVTEEPQEDASAQPTPASQKSRKQTSQDSEDDVSDYQPADEDDQTSPGHAAKSPVLPSTALDSQIQQGFNPRKTQHDGIDKGFFTAAEKAIADEIFSNVCEEENLTDYQLKVQIQNWMTCTVFKTALNDALPRRSMVALRKFAKTRYTPMEKGPWSTEQDERLRAAHTENPGRWSIISEDVGRPAQDCKDRYMHHLRYGEKEVGAWSQTEEANLVKAVRKCIKMIKKANKGDQALRRDRARLESMINWETVAQELGGKRPRRRCKIKWEKLKTRNNRMQNLADPTVLREESEWLKSQKLSRARKRYVLARIGDKINMLTEIFEVVDLDKEFNAESTFWSYVAIANPFSKYDPSMRRYNYYACLNASETVQAQPTIQETALELANELLVIHGEAARYDKARSADLKGKRPPKKSTDGLAENLDSGNRPRWGRRSLLSKENISDSSSDDEPPHDSGADSGTSRKQNVEVPTNENIEALQDENVEVSRHEARAGQQQQRRMQTPTPVGQQEFASPLTISSMNSAWDRDRRSPVLGREQFQAMVRKRVGGSSTH